MFSKIKIVVIPLKIDIAKFAIKSDKASQIIVSFIFGLKLDNVIKIVKPIPKLEQACWAA